MSKLDLTKVNRAMNAHRVASLIGLILLVAIGVFMIIVPIAVAGIIIWVIVALCGLAALAMICQFIYPGKGKTRNAASFIIGIFLAILVVGIILLAVYAKDVQYNGETIKGANAFTLRAVFFFSIFFGILTTIYSIFGLASACASKVPGKGWIIAGMALSIVIGVLAIVFPFIMTSVSFIISGVYFVIAGIIMIVILIKHWKDPVIDLVKPVEVVQPIIENEEENKEDK